MNHFDRDGLAQELAKVLTLDRPLVFFDLETTGTNVNSDRIVELGYFIVYPDGGSVIGCLRFNPEMPIPEEATAVHGISDEDVADLQTFKAAAQSFVSIFGDYDLAGFNIRRFDLPLLLEEFKRAGAQFSLKDRRLIDLQTIFHHENPRDLSAAVQKYLGKSHGGAHAAQADVDVCVGILAAQILSHDLPADSAALHAYCDAVSPFETEVQKWFDLSGPIPIFKRGKHVGKDVAFIARRWPDYFDWMLKLDDLGSDVKDIAREAIMGGYR